MQLSTDEVQHVAELAKLALSEEEVAQYAEQLSSILDYADALRAVDTSSVPPTPYILATNNVMRADVPRPSLKADEALANAPDSERGFFRVRAVFEE